MPAVMLAVLKSLHTWDSVIESAWPLLRNTIKLRNDATISVVHACLLTQIL